MRKLFALAGAIAILAAVGACSFNVGTIHIGDTETPTPTLTPTATSTPLPTNTPTRTPTSTPTPTKVPVLGVDKTLVLYGMGMRFTKAYFSGSYDADLDGNGVKTYYSPAGSKYLVLNAVISGDITSLTLGQKSPWQSDLWVENEFGDKFQWGDYFWKDYLMDWVFLVPQDWTTKLILLFKDGTEINLGPLFQ